MRIFDSFKIACHNIFYNKSRTVLTVVIIFIVSSLLMLLNIFAISFNQNLNAVNKQVFSEIGTSYSFGSYWGDSNTSNNVYFTSKEIAVLNEALEEYSDVIDNFSTYAYVDYYFHDDVNLEFNYDQYYSNYRPNINYISFNIPLKATENAFIDGGVWTKKDIKNKKIWITTSFIENYFKENNIILTKDTEILLLNQIHNYDGNPPIINRDIYKIAGIIDSDKIITSENNNYKPDIYIDFNDIYKEEENRVSYFSMDFKPSSDNYNFSSTYKRVKNLYKFINSNPDMRQNKSDAMSSLLGFENTRFSADIINQMKQSELMGNLIIGLVIFISFLILLLSIGSVANTIIISTDKNKKFIGLMRAQGLKTKGVNRIINIEAAVQIFIGIAISFLIILICQTLLYDVLVMTLGQVFDQLAGNIDYTIIFELPIYVPAAVFFAFLLMALLSAKGSLRKMAKMDVISIMSEVN